MKLKPQHLRDAAVVAFVIFALILVMKSKDAQRDAAVTAAVSTTTTTAVPTPSTTPTEGGGNPADITQQVRGFLEAYYLLTPEDTEQSRLQRIRQFIPGSLPPGVSVGLSEGSEPEQYRRDARLTIRGEVKDDQIKVEPAALPAGGSTNEMIAMVPVIFTVTTPEGIVVNQGEQATVSRWTNQSGAWVLVRFQAGGDME